MIPSGIKKNGDDKNYSNNDSDNDVEADVNGCAHGGTHRISRPDGKSENKVGSISIPNKTVIYLGVTTHSL